MKLGDLIRKYRQENDLSLRDFAKKAGLSHSYVSSLENGFDPRSGKEVIPTIETLKKVANAMNMELDDLLAQIGYIEPDQPRPWQPVLTEKDKRDIAKELERLINDLEHSEGLAFFNGEPLDDETKEHIKNALKLGLEIAKIKNKQKYTPKKYRK